MTLLNRRSILTSLASLAGFAVAGKVSAGEKTVSITVEQGVDAEAFMATRGERIIEREFGGLPIAVDPAVLNSPVNPVTRKFYHWPVGKIFMITKADEEEERLWEIHQRKLLQWRERRKRNRRSLPPTELA